jgi:hypothetical protein
MQREKTEGVHKVLPQSGVDSVWVLFGLQNVLIDPDEFLSATGVLAKDIVGNPVEPGRKTSFSTKASNVLVSPDKRFLRKIVGQREVCPCELPQEASNGRLMPTDQLAKGVLVFIDKNTSDEVRIG